MFMHIRHAFSYRNDNSRQNFTMTYLNDGAVNFTYKPIGSCLSDYDNGYSVVDGKCDDNLRRDQWEILPVDTGAVQLKNVYAGKCLSVDDSESNSSLKYVDCSTTGKSVHAKDMWIISAPRGNGAAP
ncbi:hypothetical protein AB3X91_41855 [Paraburkholderia sp. BR14263]